MKSSNDNNGQPTAAKVACPICKSAVSADYDPFCSKRCADVDLHRWLTGSYAIPAADDDSEGAGGDPER